MRDKHHILNVYTKRVPTINMKTEASVRNQYLFAGVFQMAYKVLLLLVVTVIETSKKHSILSLWTPCAIVQRLSICDKNCKMEKLINITINDTKKGSEKKQKNWLS